MPAYLYRCECGATVERPFRMGYAPEEIPVQHGEPGPRHTARRILSAPRLRADGAYSWRAK